MDRIALKHGLWLIVADGEKALFLKNKGDTVNPDFQVIREMEQDNPPTREQGTGRAGRAFKGAHTSRRSAVQGTDWHDLAEEKFARKAAAELERLVQKLAPKSIVVAAPPRTLADLRTALPQKIRRRVIAEIAKDFTRHPVLEIERLIVEDLNAAAK